MTKILKLNDDIDVEIEIDNNQAQEISNYTKVDTSIKEISLLLNKIMSPITNTYKELNKDVNMESAKVTVGVKIGIEGNFILAKSSANANIQVEMTFKPKEVN
ncbi:CU044_2847 family protein [Halarcobacter sp.]|uniref:CU044_2847 family protein n=1 Tax=Halarcobacter sp. TaxID=2321133 RepID=UPI002AAB0F85|nr:CU044_2847 family protein [Halarcobacter sp.]